MQPNQVVDTIVISDEELKSLTDAIHQRHGIDFSCYEPKSLKRRIVRTLHIFKLHAVHELWIKILKDRPFIYSFMDEVSVGLTSMFRDPVLWNRIMRLVKEDLANKMDLSIWHAGCSTGEEVFTLGIVLREANFPKPVKALATDISNQALAFAKKGEYSLMKLDDYNQNYRNFNSSSTLKKYYDTGNSTAFFDKGLIHYVTFEHHNLITDPFTGRYDIIFCRNVMIYFDNVAKQKIFEKFYHSLKPNGLLIIGFYDAVMPLVDATKFKVFDMDAKIFQKV